MSRVVRESDIDVDVLKTFSRDSMNDALAGVNQAILALSPLKEGYQEGHSPEVLRALYIVESALLEAVMD